MRIQNRRKTVDSHIQKLQLSYKAGTKLVFQLGQEFRNPSLHVTSQKFQDPSLYIKRHGGRCMISQYSHVENLQSHRCVFGVQINHSHIRDKRKKRRNVILLWRQWSHSYSENHPPPLLKWSDAGITPIFSRLFSALLIVCAVVGLQSRYLYPPLKGSCRTFGSFHKGEMGDGVAKRPRPADSFIVHLLWVEVLVDAPKLSN